MMDVKSVTEDFFLKLCDHANLGRRESHIEFRRDDKYLKRRQPVVAIVPEDLSGSSRAPLRCRSAEKAAHKVRSILDEAKVVTNATPHFMANDRKEDQVALRLKKPKSQAKLERLQALHRSASLGHQSRTMDISYPSV